MKLNAAKESSLREKSESLGMPFASVLQGYVLEHLLRTLTRSSYKDVLWLLDSGMIGREAYEKGLAGRLELVYMESSRKMPEHWLAAGQKLSEALAEKMLEEFFPEENRAGIVWELRPLTLQEGVLRVQALGKVEDMSVPVELCIRRLSGEGYVPQKQELAMLVEPAKRITYYLYPLENIFAENFLEIMEKLELVSDMEAFAVVDDLLRTLPVSGRHILELLEETAQAHPSIRKEKRLAQLKSYRKYAYMRKRWIKYSHHHAKDVSWEEVMDLLISFTDPLWKAFCRNEVFLDDWMPELGRFLG